MNDRIMSLLNNSSFKSSVVVRGLNRQFNFNYNQNLVVPSASIIKIFIMGEAFNQANQGKIVLNSYIMNLITRMIVISGNQETNTLIDLLGFENINKFIRDSGMTNTILQRKMLDFNARREGRENYTTAQDVALFLYKLYNGLIVNKAYSRMMIDIMKKQQNKSKMGRYLPLVVLVANKTGELEGIEHDAGYVFSPKGDYIFVMLTWDGTNPEYQKDVIGRVSREVYNVFSQ